MHFHSSRYALKSKCYRVKNHQIPNLFPRRNKTKDFVYLPEKGRQVSYCSMLISSRKYGWVEQQYERVFFSLNFIMLGRVSGLVSV